MDKKQLNVKDILINNGIVILILLMVLFVGVTKQNFFSRSNFSNISINVACRFIIAVGVDAGVSGDFPFPALVVFASPSLVGTADVANCVLRAVVGCDGAAGFLSGDVVHLDLNADGLLLHFFNLDSGSFVHNMYLPFGSLRCVFSLSVVTYSL